MDFLLEDVGTMFGTGATVASVAISLFYLYVSWKVLAKADKPGWAIFIPIYNVIVLLQIVKRPLWWFLLVLIPGVNLIISIIVMLDLAKAFGKGTGFGIGLILLPMIFFPILAFGGSEYQG